MGFWTVYMGLYGGGSQVTISGADSHIGANVPLPHIRAVTKAEVNANVGAEADARAWKG